MSKNIKVPQLRFKEFSGEWKEKRIENIFSIFSGFSFLSLDATKVGVKLVKIADIGIQEMKKDNISFLPESFLNKYDKFVLHTNDIVLALTRPILNKKLKVSKIDEFFNNSLLNQRTGKIITIESLNYIYYLLQNEKLIDKINLSIMGSEPPNLSINQIKSLGASLPQKQEQEKIASFLSKIDTKIEQLTKKEKLLNSYKKGVMQKIFSQEIRFRADDGSVFCDWEEKNLFEIIDVIDGDRGTNYPKSIEFSNDEFCLFLNAKNVTKKGFKFEEKKFITKEKDNLLSKGKLKRFDIVLTTRGSVGHFAFYNENTQFENIRINSGMVILRNKNEQVSTHYLYKIFNSNFFKKQVDKITFGSAQPQLTVKEIKKFKIYIPEIKEQTKIANFLSSIDKKIEFVSNQLAQTKEFKKGLLQLMFV